MGLAIIIPNADYSGTNLGQVTPSQTVELLSLAITGDATVVGRTAQYGVTYNPANTTQTGVTWSVVSGGTYATINASTGELTILSGASAAEVVIQATSSVNSNITVQKTLTVTYQAPTVLDWTALLATNQTQYRSTQLSAGVIDGWVYYYIHADDQSKVGQNLSTVMGSTKQEEGTLQCFKIPVSGFSTIRVPVFKSSGGYGYAFTDDGNVVKGLYQNSTIDSGTYQDIAIPSGATYLYLPLTSSIYTAVGTAMTATLS